MNEASLDPENWDEFRRAAHELLDSCIDHLTGVRERPVWRPVPDTVRQGIATATPWEGTPLPQLCDEFRDLILPYPTGNTHPRFFGWVHGTGTATGMLAELGAAAMNSNCGGRDHGAVYVERQVIEWCREVFGFPPGSSGVLTAGTSSATVIALASARVWRCGAEARRGGAGKSKLVAYASAEAHSALIKGMELLGLGSDALRLIPTDPNFAMDRRELEAAVMRDRAAGLEPFCVIATAGTVNTGAFDAIDAIADFCAEQDLWLHVDGAFGAWACLADSPWRELPRGLARAQSLAFDFHKWMYVQYDCGCVLIRDERVHRAAFATRPDYLAAHGVALAGGDPWFCDYGIDLSRGFKALKVWFALREFGLRRLGAKITDNCRQAQHMAALVAESRALEPLAATVSNICCFRYAPAGLPDGQLDAVNAAIVAQLQEAGTVAFSTTRIRGRLAIRAAIVNHRTTFADIGLAIEEVLRAGAALAPAE